MGEAAVRFRMSKRYSSPASRSDCSTAGCSVALSGVSGSRKAPPQRDHEDFMRLRRRDRTLVERLTAILRLADALDRQHASVVRGVSVKIREDRVELRPILASDERTRLTLEAKAMEEKGALFMQLFGRQPCLLPP